MKKFVFLLLSLMLLFSSSSVAFASEPIQSPTVGFHVVSENVPAEVYAHISESIPYMISDLYNTNEITVSIPFKLSNSVNDLYYSLIYVNGRIVGIYRCFESNGYYTGIFGENPEIINNFEKVSLLTSPDRPAEIIAGEHDDIYALIGSNVYTIFADPSGEKTSSETVEMLSSTHISTKVTNLEEGIVLKQPYGLERRDSSYKFLQIGWAETQGSKPWCMAYVTASIMRYKTGHGVDTISAQSVMEWAYPSFSQDELNSESLSTTKAAAFANTYSIYPVYTASRRSYSQIVKDIDADNPVAFICDNLNTGAKGIHALVCRGYSANNGNSFYSIWNPWYEEFERMYTSTNTYVTLSGDIKYLWASTMYSWD